MTDIRFIHTSDIHLGAPFLFLGARGEEHRRALREALERTVATALKERSHAIVIAGDLFDSAYAVREADLSFAAGCLASAGPSCRVVILPGSHDFWAPGSVFERERARFETAGNVHILTPDRPVATFPDLSLAVHGRALSSAAGVTRAFEGITPLEEYRYNICLAHGSVAGAGPPIDSHEEPLRLEELAPGFDYLALGHWHSYRVVREDSPPAIYSGSPEIIARDQRGAGSVASVTLSLSGARVERVPVGRRRVERVSIDCTGMRGTEELVNAAAAAARPDGDLVLELELTGFVGLEAAVDAELAVAALAERYFSVRIVGEGPELEVARAELLSMPAETVGGAFARIMLARIDAADRKDRAILEEALQTGIQLLRGRDPE